MLLTPSMPEPWNGPGVFGHLAASLFDPRSSMRLRWHAIPAYFAWGLRFLQHSSPRHHFAACTDNYHLAKYSLERTAAVSDALGLDYDRGTKGTLSIFRELDAFASKQAVCQHVAGLGMEYRVLELSAADWERGMGMAPSAMEKLHPMTGKYRMNGKMSMMPVCFSPPLICAASPEKGMWELPFLFTSTQKQAKVITESRYLTVKIRVPFFKTIKYLSRNWYNKCRGL